MSLFERSSAERILLCVAAPAEARAVLTALGADPGLSDRDWTLHVTACSIDVVVTGVGKSNAAGAAGRCLDPARHRAAFSTGVCGSLPRSGGVEPPKIGGVIVASASTFADEGLLADGGFIDQAAMRFPPAPGLTASMVCDGALVARLMVAGRVSGAPGPVLGPIATVSTCSGTDAAAAEVVHRTDAVAEAMEGAAVGLVAHRLGVAFGEIRVVSNTTGSRTRQVWDLKAALARLSDVAARLPDALRVPPATGREA